MRKQPAQPLKIDKERVLRFQENAIVRHVLDFASSRGCSLNELASIPFSKADRQQFAQLIGYSLCGYGELPYVTDAAYAEAEGAWRNAERRRKRKTR
jgi:hypothetical protein